jgi:hypothetical protein
MATSRSRLPRNARSRRSRRICGLRSVSSSISRRSRWSVASCSSSCSTIARCVSTRRSACARRSISARRSRSRTASLHATRSSIAETRLMPAGYGAGRTGFSIPRPARDVQWRTSAERAAGLPLHRCRQPWRDPRGRRVALPQHGGVRRRLRRTPRSKSRQMSKRIPCGPGGPSRTTFPFEFVSRSPMLFRIRRGGVEDVSPDPSRLVYWIGCHTTAGGDVDAQDARRGQRP